MKQQAGMDHLLVVPPREERRGQAVSRALPFSVNCRPILALSLVLATVTWFWEPLLELFSLTQQAHYSHILLIPWMSLYVLYFDRKSILASPEYNPWSGTLLMGVGALSYWGVDAVAPAADRLSMTILAFVIMSWGVFVFCLGISLCRKISFPLLFLLFMVPLPSVLLEAVIAFLQRNSAEASDFLFSVLGVPVFRQGFLFTLSDFKIHVAEECSGIRSALALLITSLLAGHFFLRSTWMKMGLVAIVVPLTILKNAFRIVGLALLANYVDPALVTDSVWHRRGGIPLFLVAFVVLFLLVWLLRRLEIKIGYVEAH
jgi:exosortase